jgi:hypothetical protein
VGPRDDFGSEPEGVEHLGGGGDEADDPHGFSEG